MSQLPRRAAVAAVRLYQAWRPLRGGGPVCRFEPSCSAYAVQALQTWGLLRGSWLAVRRVSRCHPWGAVGDDPVPARTVTPRSARTATPAYHARTTTPT